LIEPINSGSVDSNGHLSSSLCDVELERLFVNALLCDPSRHDCVDVTLTDFVDPHSYHAFKAFANVRARGPVTHAAVRQELADTGIIAAVSGLHADPDRGWFDELFAVQIGADDPVVGWAFQLLNLSARRAQAVEEADASLREQYEIDARALDDAEPAPVIPIRPAPDPWTVALATALTDVTRALGAMKHSERKPMFVDAAELFTREYPQTPWLVTGLMSRGGLTLLGAEPKSCKTWLAVEIAIAVATGTKVCGEFFAEHGTVAYFFAEDLDVQVRNRVRALMAARGVSPETICNLYVCPRGQFLDITKNEDLAWIIASCRKIGRVDLVVLDPLRDISSAAEDKSDEMSPVMRRLRLIAELLGCTVAVSHHAGKPTKETAARRPGQRMRGSSAIYGSTDSGIYFGLRGGDGVAKFELDIDVEIKGARSAGHVTAVLEVEDDGEGQATKASWSITRERSSDTQYTMEDDMVFRFVRELAMRGIVTTRRQLRDHDEAPMGDRQMRTSLDRLIDSGRLVLERANVKIPCHNGKESYQ